MCPKDTDFPACKRKLLTPEKHKGKLLTPSRMRTETDGRTGVAPYALSIILRMAGAQNKIRKKNHV